MAVSNEELEAHLRAYQDALSAFDAKRSAELWGVPGTIVSDTFAGSLDTHEEMAAGLQQSYPLYQRLGLHHVDHETLERVHLTERLLRIRVRWLFYDAAGQLLTDGHYEYLLRRDDEGLRTYVAVAIDEQEKLIQLAQRQGIDLG
ncbi:MAG TPA: hypothetical protein VJ625_02370 [Propionibacteriaceae bacterium]|nr:hypothetical protein [Propionibacteriaceae bacterium]